VDIAGKGYQDKINHAYRYGIQTTIATVEKFSGILVDHYVLFNFDGFTKAIDTMGGLTLEVDSDVARELETSVGQHHLDGKQVLEYVRFRDDSAGDFGRNDRHQLVLKAVLEQSKEQRSLKEIQEILDTVGEDVRTDLTFSQMVSLASQWNDFSGEQLERIKYKAHTARFGPQNLSYVIIDEQERQRVMNLLRQAAQYFQKE
jgi:LCP family protein required for cell wall assembly